MTTLKDLSQHLGLSVTQVSRAINDHWDVKQSTKERVWKAAEELGYKPNLTARKLVTGKSGTVCFVQEGIPPKEEAWLFMQIISNLSREFTRLGRQFLFHLADESDDVLGAYENLVRGKTVDGFVLINPKNQDPRIDFLLKREVPFVCHGRAMDDAPYPYYDIDNYAVGYNLTSLLISQGHREIAFLNGREGLAFSTRRHRGYLDALEEGGIGVDAGFVAHGQMVEAFGHDEAARLLTRTDGPRPTGFVASNTRIASGIFRACTEFGLSVPQDVSIVAHDDALSEVRSDSLPTPLTVTVAPLSESWAPMARLLTAAIDGAPLEKTQILQPVEVIERASIAPAS